MFVEPAASILEILGGPAPVARHLGVGHNTVVRWRYPKARGTGGVIPRKYHDPLIGFAARLGLELPRGAFSDPDLALELLRRRRQEASAA